MPSNSPITILGIDPGYDRVGWAIGSKTQNGMSPVAFGCIQTESHASIWVRYQQIITDLRAILKQYKPDHLAIEELFFSKNVSTAIRVSEARGVIIAAALGFNIEIFEYKPNTIKLAVTGDGQASKAAVSRMVSLQLKLTNQIGKKNHALDDATDALAIALTHAVTYRPTNPK